MGGTSLNTCCCCLPPDGVGGGGANTLLGPGRTGPCGSFLVSGTRGAHCLVGVRVWWVAGGGVGGVCASVAGPAFLCLPVGGCGGGGVWLWIMVFS